MINNKADSNLLPLKLESDRSAPVDQHVEPAARPGQCEPVVGRAAGPVNAHAHPDDALPGLGHNAPAYH